MEHTDGGDKWEAGDVEADVDDDEGGYIADKKKNAKQPQFGLYVPNKASVDSAAGGGAAAPKRLGPREAMMKAREAFMSTSVRVCVVVGVV